MISRLLNAVAAASLGLAFFLLVGLVLRTIEIEPTTPVIAALFAGCLALHIGAVRLDDALAAWRERRDEDAARFERMRSKAGR